MIKACTYLLARSPVCNIEEPGADLDVARDEDEVETGIDFCLLLRFPTNNLPDSVVLTLLRNLGPLYFFLGDKYPIDIFAYVESSSF